MAIYDFIGKNLTLNNVKSIITKAKFDVDDYTYKARVDHDGFVVMGEEIMSTTLLRNAAVALKIKVDISSPSMAQPGVDNALEGANYKLHFTMNQTTLDALQGWNLVVFKGVKAPGSKPDSSAPLAWIVSDSFGLGTTIAWNEEYSAYTSTNQIVPNGVITATNPAAIDIGETYNVTQSGAGDVARSGQQNAISIHNLSDRQFTCGIAQTPAGSSDAQAICAFTLYGGTIDVIIPEEKVFMMFVSHTVDTGTVFENSVSRGLFIDLTGVEGRDGVTYDVNKGWDWGGFSWAKQIPASSDLVPLLIDSSVALKVRRVERLTLAA